MLGRYGNLEGKTSDNREMVFSRHHFSGIVKLSAWVFGLLPVCALASAPSQSADETLIDRPSAMRLSIGGIVGPSFVVELKDGILVYRSSKRGFPSKRNPADVSRRIKPTAEQWEQFWAALDEVRIWEWNAKYVERRISCGTHWGIVIRSPARQIVSSGSNSYPSDGDDMRPTRVRARTGILSDEAFVKNSQRFRKYLRAVRELLGGLAFDG